VAVRLLLILNESQVPIIHTLPYGFLKFGMKSMQLDDNLFGAFYLHVTINLMSIWSSWEIARYEQHRQTQNLELSYWEPRSNIKRSRFVFGRSRVRLWARRWTNLSDKYRSFPQFLLAIVEGVYSFQLIIHVLNYHSIIYILWHMGRFYNNRRI
jgi:hypothetical protein